MTFDRSGLEQRQRRLLQLTLDALREIEQVRARPVYGCGGA